MVEFVISLNINRYSQAKCRPADIILYAPGENPNVKDYMHYVKRLQPGKFPSGQSIIQSVMNKKI